MINLVTSFGSLILVYVTTNFKFHTIIYGTTGFIAEGLFPRTVTTTGLF